MEYRIDSRESAVHVPPVAHVTLESLHLGIEIRWEFTATPMNLLRQIIERSDPVSSRQKGIGDMGADKARSAGDEHSLNV
jgi:hypothetical protein